MVCCKLKCGCEIFAFYRKLTEMLVSSLEQAGKESDRDMRYDGSKVRTKSSILFYRYAVYHT